MSFLARLFKNRVKNVTITICGLDAAGKTTLINYLMTGEFTNTEPTLGVNREILDLPKLHISIMDLGGQEDFRGIWSEVNERTDGLIYVVDSTDFIRQNETKSVFYNIINTQVHNEIPILLLLNKIDVDNRISRADFISEFSLADLNLSWKCYETSAKTGEGIYSAFKWLVDALGDGA
ncbi:MAG: GTP-binding protein [Asgard group archaeon]|nr:GTP-binding protein [Asgard group archaeon]